MIEGKRVTVRLALEAMATRFELVLMGTDSVILRAAGEEALREINSIARRFSFYNTASELVDINRRASRMPVRVASDLFELVSRSFAVSEKTHGAFDPAIGPLMRCWGFYRGTGRMPDQAALEKAQSVSGATHVILDKETSTIRFDTEGVELDLGGIAKGYAIDEAVRLLREAGVANALIHGGTSTVAGMGTSYDGVPWRISISDQGQDLGTVELEDSSLSVSASSGKSFVHGGVMLGHVLDPRTGRPGRGAAVAAVTGPSAEKTDALSTAALVLAASSSSLAGGDIGIGVWSEPCPEGLHFVSGLSGYLPPSGQITVPAAK